VVQLTQDGLAVRRVLVQEMPRVFDARRYGVAAAVDTEHPKAASAFGGSANGDVFMFQLDRLLAHIKPPQPFVPTSIDQVFAPATAVGLLEVM
jgi:hypothetical protein